jgi:hypothetical protein
MPEALGSIPSTPQKKRGKGKEREDRLRKITR